MTTAVYSPASGTSCWSVPIRLYSTNRQCRQGRHRVLGPFAALISPADKRVHQYQGRMLSHAEIPLAQNILYEIFVREKKWEPGPDNPSGIQVDHLRRLVTDKFDGTCTWFGVFDKKKLVGCCRTSQGVNGKFELEEYHPVPDHWPRPAQEINRMAFLPAYRASKQSIALFCMLHAWLVQCDLEGIMTFFCTTQLPKPGGLFMSLGMRKAEGKALRNDRWEQDGEDTWLLYTTRECLPGALKKVERLCDMAASRSQG